MLQYITCTIDPEVMTFVAQDIHSIKATVYMQREHFSRYRFTGSDEPPRFTVGSEALVGCLGIIASNVNDACKMKYAGEGAVLEIRQVCAFETMYLNGFAHALLL
jgi:hypothetical protein